MGLRNRINQSAGCSFDTTITADYDDRLYTFSVSCKVDSNGMLTFKVLKPDTIVGITGSVEATGGKLTFDDTVLGFPLLADGLVSPVSAPWLFVHSLRSGYIHAYESNEDGFCVIIHDSFQQTPLQMNVYCDKEALPCLGEIYWDGSRIITLEISNFLFL